MGPQSLLQLGFLVWELNGHVVNSGAAGGTPKLEKSNGGEGSTDSEASGTLWQCFWFEEREENTQTNKQNKKKWEDYIRFTSCGLPINPAKVTITTTTSSWARYSCVDLAITTKVGTGSQESCCPMSHLKYPENLGMVLPILLSIETIVKPMQLEGGLVSWWTCCSSHLPHLKYLEI